MAYSIVLGDLGPTMPVGLVDDGVPFAVSEETDTITLRYYGSDGTPREVELDIISAEQGQCEAAWDSGDLPVVGYYRGLVIVERDEDTTFPRTFPSDGSKIIWFVAETISAPPES